MVKEGVFFGKKRRTRCFFERVDNSRRCQVFSLDQVVDELLIAVVAGHVSILPRSEVRCNAGGGVVKWAKKGGGGVWTKKTKP